MNFIKKNLTNILFVLFALYLFSPYGLPVRAYLIRGISMITTGVFNLEVADYERDTLTDYSWQLVDLKGKPLDFESLKGEVILVNYWATWCPPCVAEMPSMQKLYDDYGDRVKFVFVARDEHEKVLKFLERKDLDLPVLYERTAPPTVLSSNSLPTTFLIDANGVIRIDKVGAADWNSRKVRNLLDDLIQ